MFWENLFFFTTENYIFLIIFSVVTEPIIIKLASLNL